MKKMIVIMIITTIFISIYGCKDSLINPNTGSTIKYYNIFTVNKDELTVKVFLADQDSLTTGYNNIYFKAFNQSNEIKTGYITMYPKMWMTPRIMHSTAAKDKYYYDQFTGYYSGYVVFVMPSTPPNIIWYTEIAYIDNNNNQYTFDSAATYVSYHPEKQWRLFLDTTDEKSWMISLVDSYTPVKGLNNLKMILHKTDAELKQFTQINNAIMKIKVYDLATGIESAGNVSPIPNINGVYEGKMNFTQNAEWKVCDTIWYNGIRVTGNPPPSPDFYFQIK